MMPLIGVTLGAVLGAGLWLVVAGVRGVAVLPRQSEPARPVNVQLGLVLALLAVVVALAVWQLTGWPVLAVAAGASVLLLRRMWRDRGRDQRRLERTEAIAVWAEMIRDNLAGSAGLEQALVLSAAYAPEAIAPEVSRFVARLDRHSLYEGLRELGEDLDNTAADLIVVSLAQGARSEARELGPLLSRLASSIRADVEMQQRVDVGRARIRTSARIVVVVMILTVVFLMMTSRNLLAVYDTPGGQMWMIVVLGVFALSGWLLRRYSQVGRVGRFSLRPEWFGEVES